MTKRKRRLLFLGGLVLALGTAAGVVYLLTRPAGPADKRYSPFIHGPSKEAETALSSFRLPKGMEARVWAAEPMLANPVSFCFDEKGRCYVAETFRLHHGVTDNRDHPEWLDDDLASRTVEDRVAMYHKHLGDKFHEYETEHDRVRLLEDTRGEGKADKATVFADGFHDAATGIGAGLLARKGNVYYTCIPDLWLLKDTKGGGEADVRQSLAHGFGVHVCFFGHDLHGLRMGPDGRLYFSIGDRGLNVTTGENKVLFNPDSGAVLRCEPDGSDLELVATGLRNPQELAFDAHGNLFTVDNNSDSGDRARLVYVVAGGDSGWRTGYQYGSDLGDRGPFNAEKVWSLGDPDQPAGVVPPLAHITTGPAGLCYNPGATALPPRYSGHFFVCDFQGASGRSGVWSFAVKPKGAAFEIADSHEFIKGILATDCDFGPDGGFYVSDWVHGWALTGKGRIYRFAETEAAKDPLLAEVKTLLAEGFGDKSADELAKLLGHADQRVRQEAQFALAEKGPEALRALERVAQEGPKNLPARLHGVWGLGQLARGGSTEAAAVLAGLLKASDAEVRAQAARALADSRKATAGPLLPLLSDPAPRVRFFAALALAGTKLDRDGVRGVVAMLRDNADGDAYLRHAGALALAAAEDPALLLSAAKDEAAPVRLAVTVALRRRRAPEVAEFLADADARVATEAARVIHDEPIPEALPKLAGRLDKSKQPELLLWRALNANYRLGKSENAAALAAFAARADVPEGLRVEAVKMLGGWANPGRRDRVTGLTQDLGRRDPAPAAAALRARLDGLLTGPDDLLAEAAAAAGALGLKDVAPQMLGLASDTKRKTRTRVAALRALGSLNDEYTAKAMRLALADAEPRVRAEGRRLLARANPGEAVAALAQALEQGEPIEKQAALAVLGEIKGAEADALLGKALDRLLAKDYPVELQVDLLEAAATRNSGSVKEKLRRYEDGQPKDDPLAEYRGALAGGDAEAGRRVFFTKTEAACLRCHKVKGEGGDVGPDLAGIGGKQTRLYLLESIVEPDKQIAQGYESVVLTLTNGTVVSGVLKGEDAKDVKVLGGDGKLVTVPKAKIDERQRGKSAMPDDVVRHLTKRELRDVVEFLAGLRE